MRISNGLTINQTIEASAAKIPIVEHKPRKVAR
jgi:hypothetical protein